jgi:hypothetical protein
MAVTESYGKPAVVGEGRPWDEIVTIVRARQTEQSPLLAQMKAVRDRYNGDYAIPMPGTADEVTQPPLAPAIIADAIDHTAMAAASVMPAISVPAAGVGPRFDGYANTRRRALGYTWGASAWNLHARRAFRHLAGYATTSLMVVPDFRMECPRIVLRDPLGTFPDPRAAEQVDQPENTAFIYARSGHWIARNYPQAKNLVAPDHRLGARMWHIVEWVDCEVIVLGILGPQSMERSSLDGSSRRGHDPHVSGWPRTDTHHHDAMELKRWPNRAGRCPAYTMNRVTLDRIASQVANIVGQVDLLARITALDIRATERSIFPDTYIVGSENRTPVLHGGQWKEGVTGEVNLLTDTAQIGQLRNTPDPAGRLVADRLERNARVSGGLVPQFGGETYGALRTGRGIDALMGAAVDPRVQELQELMAHAMTEINEVVIDSYKGYWPKRTYHVFSRWPTDRRKVEFVPEKHFECADNVVSYPIPGADIQQTTVNLGQLYGANAISLKTFRAMHPWVGDPEFEDDQRRIEALEEALFTSVQQRASEGGIPPADLARIAQLLQGRDGQGKTLAEAVMKVDEEAAERQAAAPPPEAADPLTGMAPGQMPGLANPGEGAEMGTGIPPEGLAPIQTPPNLDQFRELTRALRAPQPRSGY